jgi:hypothetical protein
MSFPETSITTVDREFAQAMFVSAVDTSYKLGFIEACMTAFVHPPAGLFGAGKSLVEFMVATGKNILQYADKDDLKKAKIYASVRDVLSARYKTNAAARTSAGTAFSW